MVNYVFPTQFVAQKDFLYLSLEIHKRHNPGITHSPYYRFYFSNQKYFGQKYFPPKLVNYQNILKRNFMGLSTVVLDTEKTGKIHFSDVRPEDYYLWLNLITKSSNLGLSCKNQIGHLCLYLQMLFPFPLLLNLFENYTTHQ